MFTVSITGHIGSLTPKTTANGKNLLTMRVAVKYWQKDATGQNVEMTQWCECTAWEQAIQFWERFRVGDAVEITGRAHIDVWTGKDSGKTGCTLQLFGLEGGTPAVRWTPGKSNREDNAGSGGGRYSRGGNAGSDARADDDLAF